MYHSSLLAGLLRLQRVELVLAQALCPLRGSGVANWSKIGFVVDFRNLLFGRDFDLSFSKDYSLMKIFNYEGHFTAKCDT
jgi:hypothetical protein